MLTIQIILKILFAGSNNHYQPRQLHRLSVRPKAGWSVIVFRQIKGKTSRCNTARILNDRWNSAPHTLVVLIL